MIATPLSKFVIRLAQEDAMAIEPLAAFDLEKFRLLLGVFNQQLAVVRTHQKQQMSDFLETLQRLRSMRARQPEPEPKAAPDPLGMAADDPDLEIQI